MMAMKKPMMSPWGKCPWFIPSPEQSGPESLGRRWEEREKMQMSENQGENGINNVNMSQ